MRKYKFKDIIEFMTNVEMSEGKYNQRLYYLNKFTNVPKILYKLNQKYPKFKILPYLKHIIKILPINEQYFYNVITEYKIFYRTLLQIKDNLLK
jgi:hypothetical protein